LKKEFDIIRCEILKRGEFWEVLKVLSTKNNETYALKLLKMAEFDIKEKSNSLKKL